MIDPKRMKCTCNGNVCHILSCIRHSHTHFSLNIIAHSIRGKFFNINFVQNNSFFLLVAGNFYMNSIRHTLALHKYRKLLRFKWKNLKRATFEPLKFAIAQYRILSGFYFLDCISIKFHAIIVIPFGFVCSLFSIENRKINTNNPMKYITSTCFKYIFPLVCPTCAHPIYHE